MDVSLLQVLVTQADFYDPERRNYLSSTLDAMLKLNIVPILNTNDAVAPPSEASVDLRGVLISGRDVRHRSSTNVIAHLLCTLLVPGITVDTE